jgi:hypothetical protein
MTCAECLGACCFSVSYHAPNDEVAKQFIRKNGMCKNEKSHAEFMAAGHTHVWEVRSTPCGVYQAPGCGLEHKHKPHLCRSYWCHGKYFVSDVLYRLLRQGRNL